MSQMPEATSVSDVVARDTPTVAAVDTSARERNRTQKQEGRGSSAVQLRMLLANALHEHEISESDALDCMRLIDEAETSEMTKARSLKVMCRNALHRVWHLFSERLFFFKQETASDISIE